MNAVMDALINHPTEFMAVAALVLIVCVVAIVYVLVSNHRDRRRRQRAKAAPRRYVSGTPVRRPVQPVDQTRVMARQFPARPDDMTAVQYVIEPIEGWGGRRG